MTRKYCIVPMCISSSAKTPNKLFFTVPFDLKIRRMWMKVMKRADPIGPKSHVHCCEDHFDIENDMENYIKYKLVGGQLKLKRDVAPHKFSCQKQLAEKSERSFVKNRKELELINKLDTRKNIPYTSEQVLIVPIKQRSTLEKVQKKVVVSYDAYICVKEELREANEAVETLKQKAAHFEEIIKLKDIQIDDLQKQLDKNFGERRDELKEEITRAIENASVINQSRLELEPSWDSVVDKYICKSEAVCKEDLDQINEIEPLEASLPIKQEVDIFSIKEEIV